MSNTEASMAESSAAQRVLETPELLEMIVSSLPPMEILVLQRVSQIWHGVIVNSPPIQRLLFMRPQWELEGKSFSAWRPVNRPGDRPRNNRMLRRILDGRYPTVTLQITNDDEEPEHRVEVQNDTLGVTVPGRSRPDNGHWSWNINITYPADQLPSENPAVLYEKASWRKMYICQPPCKSLYLVRNSKWQKSAHPAIECETGITMQDFMDKVSKAKEAWNNLYIGSDRDWHLEGGIKCSSIQE